MDLMDDSLVSLGHIVSGNRLNMGEPARRFVRDAHGTHFEVWDKIIAVAMSVSGQEFVMNGEAKGRFRRIISAPMEELPRFLNDPRVDKDLVLWRLEGEALPPMAPEKEEKFWVSYRLLGGVR